MVRIRNISPADPPAQAAGGAASPRWRLWALGVLVAAASFVPFIPAITAGFVALDDPGILADTHSYRGLAADNLRWMFTATTMGHYQPLTWVSYAIDYLTWGQDPAGLWGLNPIGFHLTNLGLHALNAALVFLLARRLLAAASTGAGSLAIDVCAAGAALLFGMHPLRVESVAWVTERRDVLSGFFLLLAALAYLRAFPARSTAVGSRAWYAVSVALLLLSLLSKAWGMTFFVVLIVLDWFPLGRLSGPIWGWLRVPYRNVLIQKAPYAVLGVAAALTAGYATGSIRFTVLSFERWGLDARLCQAMFGLMFYVQKMLWPTRLACLYEIPSLFHLEPRFVVAIAFTGAAALGAFALRRRLPAFTAAALTYAVILAPVLGIRQSGPQLVADRYSYLANIAWAVVIAGAALAWARQSGKKAAGPAIAFGCVIAGALGALSWHQTGFWRDSATLFKRVIDTGSDGPIAREFYGRQLSERKQWEEALVQFRTGIEMDASYGECWFSEANTLRQLHRFQEAEDSYLVARKLVADSWRPNLMLGLMLIDAVKDLPDDDPKVRESARRAEMCFRAAIANVESLKLDPAPGRPYLMLAAALDIQGDEPGARQMLQQAAQCPDTRDEALERLREMDAPR